MPQLTVNDEYILDYLLEHARQTQTELQERIGAGISPSSVGRSLNRLEDYGYVEQCHTFDRETLKPKTVYRVTADGKAKRMDSEIGRSSERIAHLRIALNYRRKRYT